jgi:tetratricopeptide (TPR) repeat protein
MYCAGPSTDTPAVTCSDVVARCNLTGEHLPWAGQSFRAPGDPGLPGGVRGRSGDPFVRAGAIQPLSPHPDPGADSGAYVERSDLLSGKLADAIKAYQRGVAVAPGDARLAAELARIQAYSSALLTTTAQKQARLAEARQSIDAAVGANPDEAVAHAVRTLVYDWSASVAPDEAERDRLLKEAQSSAVRALQLDPGSPLAKAYYGELLLDQGKFVQASDLAERAAADADPLDPMSMDIHRVFGTVLEAQSYYRRSTKYLSAVGIAQPPTSTC